MGTTQYLLPNGNKSGTGAYSLVGGGSTVHGNLSDSSDSTRVQRTTSGDKTAQLNLGTYTLAVDERVKRVRAAARVMFNAKPLFYSWGVYQSGYAYPATERTRQAKNTSVTTYYTDWVDGSAIAAGADPVPVQSDIDSLFMFIRDKESSSLNYFYDIWVELDIIDQPTVTVSPGSTSTLRPTITWVYADGDGDSQSLYRVKVFDSATYGGGGFDPETSTPAFDSDIMSGDVETYRDATQLANGTTYKAYVRVAHDGGYEDYWSDWAASSAWTVSITACTTPTMTGIYSEGDGRVELSITGAAPPGGVTQTLRVERSTDSGATWAPVRGYADAVFDSPYTPTVYDYEAPLGVSCAYRARALGVNATDDDTSSPWSATNTESPWVDGGWWLKCPLDPSLNASGVWVLAQPEISVDETIGVFRPIGADKALTVAGDLYGEDGSWQIRAGDTDDYQTIATIGALMRTQNVLFVSDPFGGNRYVRIVSRSRSVEGTGDYPRTVWQVSYVEVDAPAVT